MGANSVFSNREIATTDVIMITDANGAEYKVPWSRVETYIDKNLNFDGTGTNGINVSGTYTTAINVSTAQTDETGLTAACVFQHGDYTTPIAYGTQTDHLFLKSMNITGAATACYIFGNLQKVTTSADSTGYIHVAYNSISVGHDLVNGYATRSAIAITDTCVLGEMGSVLGTLTVAASKAVTATGAATLSAGIFDTEIAAGATVAQEVTCLEIRPRIRADVAGSTCGIRININCEQANYVDYGLDIRSMSTNQTAAIRVYSNSQALPCGLLLETKDSGASGSITNAISLVGTFTNVLDFAEENGSQGVTTATGAVGNTTHKIAIDVAGTMRYIAVYDAVASGA